MIYLTTTVRTTVYLDQNNITQMQVMFYLPITTPDFDNLLDTLAPFVGKKQHRTPNSFHLFKLNKPN